MFRKLCGLKKLVRLRGEQVVYEVEHVEADAEEMPAATAEGALGDDDGAEWASRSGTPPFLVQREANARLALRRS